MDLLCRERYAEATISQPARLSKRISLGWASVRECPSRLHAKIDRIEHLSLQRKFSIWDYTVSHSTLLLRSVDADAYATRFDVMFKPVAAFKLPTQMLRLTVRDAHGDEADELGSEASLLAGVAARLTGADQADYRLFVLDCDGALGWVLASVMVAYEDEAGYEDPSAVLHGTPAGALVATVST